MTQSTRTARKLAPPPIDAFDDRLWPITALLVVLALVVGSTIVYTGDFETTLIWANAWVHLGMLAVVMLFVAVASFFLHGRLQRRMQLALVFSLLLHVWLSLVSHRVTPPGESWRVADAAKTTPDTLPFRAARTEVARRAAANARKHVHRAEASVETQTPDLVLPNIERQSTARAPQLRTSRWQSRRRLSRNRRPPPTSEAAEMTAPRRGESLVGEQIPRQESEQPLEATPADAPVIAEQPRREAPRSTHLPGRRPPEPSQPRPTSSGNQRLDVSTPAPDPVANMGADRTSIRRAAPHPRRQPASDRWSKPGRSP